MAGAEWDPGAYGLGGVVRHLGLLPYEDTGALYRACDAGLVAMATRHPSYLPFELMASGAVVVTNLEVPIPDGCCEMGRTLPYSNWHPEMLCEQ